MIPESWQMFRLCSVSHIRIHSINVGPTYQRTCIRYKLKKPTTTKSKIFRYMGEGECNCVCVAVNDVR